MRPNRLRRPAPPPSPSHVPATPDVPPPSPKKLERLAATRLVKQESRTLRPLIRSFYSSIDALGAVNEKAEKALAVLDRPKPPRVRAPPAKVVQVISRWEARVDKALVEMMSAHVAMLEQKNRVVGTQLASRDLQIARLRRLLRKHRIATSWGVEIARWGG